MGQSGAPGLGGSWDYHRDTFGNWDTRARGLGLLCLCVSCVCLCGGVTVCVTDPAPGRAGSLTR